MQTRDTYFDDDDYLASVSRPTRSNRLAEVPANYEPKGPPNGNLPLMMFGHMLVLTGGPYLNRPKNMLGIKMAEEIRAYADIDIPTVDFTTPPPEMVYNGVIEMFVESFRNDNAMWYVGCMAGRGRTGVFMVSAAQMTGVTDPLTFVRTTYFKHACETKSQEAFATQFNPDTFRIDLMRALADARVVRFRHLRAMSWADRLFFLKARFGTL